MEKTHIYQRYVKRPMDFILAFNAFIVLSPLFLVITVLIRIKLGKPVIFRQNRPGENGKMFALYKFRTMLDKRDEFGVLLPDENRLTKFGEVLRSSSIDELPELINIMKGDMSLVGPRPLLEQYLPLYNKNQKRRHEVKPGLSGLAQISGRNGISWENKLKLDVQYVDNIRFLEDWKIIFLTIKKIIVREGIYSNPDKSADLFKGPGKLLIIGAGGHGRVVADHAKKIGQWEEINFLDDNLNLKYSMGLKVIGTIKDVILYKNDYDIFIALGNSKKREELQQKLEELGARIPILIHPSAIIGENVEIGTGTVIMAGAIIQCCTKIGKGCIVNTGSTIDHDNIIGCYVHIAPGAHIAGNVQICDKSWIGIGASIRNNIQIIDNCMIGAGAVVVGDITKNGIYVGVPAKLIQHNPK